ncbi:MAG TPA: tail fiber protein [Fimbriimonadaceae bacterium]|nr:tail fiber protein [Fimbriimonadaceae bacterium]
MATPYIGEIRVVPYNFAPVGWAFCDGSVMAISQNEALFALIGTTYGGDGVQTFALPDLRGRVPVGQGNSFVIGQPFGAENVTLNTNQLPAHNHLYGASTNPATTTDPTSGYPAKTVRQIYISGGFVNVQMNPNIVTQSGGSQPHPNIQPYTCISFIIALFGVFPSQS